MPVNLHIYVGNHLEILAGALAELVRQSSAGADPDPLQPEIILVQSQGMQRWLSMALARQNGICANMSFPFPNAFLEGMYAHVFADLPELNPFAINDLTFRIMALLPELLPEKAFAPVRNYLSGRSPELKSYQLSRKIADIFDQYLVFRPEMILEWEQGRKSGQPQTHSWQAILWQRLIADIESPHRANLQSVLVRTLLDDRISISNLPHRVSVFGISHLPIFHLKVLDALSHRLPVNLFLFNPCRQYWADIMSDHQLIGIRSGSRTAAAADTNLHFDRGNRLLASWGVQGRQFFGLTHQLEALETELYRDNSDETLLGCIQQDILDLVDRSGHENFPRAGVSADQTLRIHICHSPMREVEVLHDQLLDIFSSHPDIHPDDILVMTPDIGHYAPYIHAVFGTPGDSGENSIPYTVADQNITGQSKVVEGYLRLLQLKDSRLELSQVLQLLEYEAVRRKFGFDERDLLQVENWLRDANVRWGWNAQDCRRHGMPRFEENTWRAGLDRLIAGYAMDTDGNDLFAGILPYEGIDASSSETLGNLILFAETLSRRLRKIPAKASLNHWASILAELIDMFMHVDEQSTRELQALRRGIEQLSLTTAAIQSQDDIAFEVVRQFLIDTLKHSFFGTGFMAGSITFCAMLPMRSIPAKVICLLGLQHDAFPQEVREPGFNLIAADPRPGDRSKRNDDKYLFLEALLSARRIFYASYIGRDIQDNAPKPPSVLVDELLEYVADNYGIDPRKLVVIHPLQAFSPAYFNRTDWRLFTYSRENREAAGSLRSSGEIRPFFRASLPHPEDEWRLCDPARLEAFFNNPAKYLLEQRLGIYLRNAPATVEDRENFNLDPLSRYLIGRSLLESSREGRSVRDHFETLSAAGELPPGTAGRVVHDQIDQEVNKFLKILQRETPPEESSDAEIELELQPFHISGRIQGVYPRYCVQYRMARLRPIDLLSAFIKHLMLNMAPQDHIPRSTRLICKDAVWEFSPVSSSLCTETLSTYLDLYWEGLQYPLPFFPRTSYEYAFKRIVKEKEHQDARADALKKWRGGYNQTGDSQDAYAELCFKHENPLTGRFESLALTVFGPIFSVGRQSSSDN